MDTMEITKLVGAACGALLIFLLIRFGAEMVYDTHSEMVAFIIETGEEEAPAEEEAPVVDVAALLAEADASAGEGIFRRCAGCHRIDGSDGAGPHLDGVVGRDKAAAAGFNYSPALSGLPGEWTVEDLYHFINHPAGFAPGTTMNFAGISRETDLANLIAYLQSLSN
jgi:cytochrome c